MTTLTATPASLNAFLAQSGALTNGIGMGSSRLGSVVISTKCEIYAYPPRAPFSEPMAWGFPFREEFTMSGTNAFVAGARSSMWY